MDRIGADIEFGCLVLVWTIFVLAILLIAAVVASFKGWAFVAQAWPFGIIALFVFAALVRRWGR